MNELIIVQLALNGFNPHTTRYGPGPYDAIVDQTYKPYYPDGFPWPVDPCDPTEGSCPPFIVAGNSSACLYTQSCLDAFSRVTNAQSWSQPLAYGVAFLFAPVAGYLADTIGRKPVLFMSGLCLTVPSLAIFGVFKGMSPYWYYAALPVMGLVPANVGWGSILADRTLPSERAPIYAMLLAGEDFDGVLLPMIVSRVPVQTTIIMVLSLLGVLLIVSTFFVKETMTAERRQELKAAQASGGVSRISGIKMLVTDPKLRGVTFLAFTAAMMAAGVQAIALTFYKARFGLGYEEASPLFSVYYATNFIMNVFLVRPLVSCMGTRKLLIFAYMVWTSFSISMCLVTTVPALYVTIALSCFASSALPNFFALFNNAVGPEMRSQIVAAVVMIQSLGKVFGPFLFNQFFHYLLTHDLGISWSQEGQQVGVVFLAQAVLQILSIFIIMCLPQELFKPSSDENAAVAH